MHYKKCQPVKVGGTKHRASPPLQKVGGTCPPVHPWIYAHVAEQLKYAFVQNKTRYDARMTNSDMSSPGNGTSRHVTNARETQVSAMCPFSKYLIAVPLPDKSAVNVAKALVKHVFFVYGAIEFCFTDRGKEFENKVLQNG